MKRLLLLTAIVFSLSVLSFGQNTNVSLETKRFIRKVKKYERLQKKPDKQLEKIKEYYPLFKINDRYYIGGIIKVTE